MSKPTISSIAKQLGLSKGTVSKALKDGHEISIETKKKIFALVKELNYVPNPYASSLRKQKSKTIAVVLPEITDSFFALAINGIESVAIQKGYHVLIYLTHENFEREVAIMHEFKSGRVDGILLSVSSDTCNSGHINEVINEGLPVVFFDRKCEDVNTSSIVTNDFESGYAATKHLIEKGCTNIAYLNISPNLIIFKNRIAGYRQACQDFKLTILENNIVHCKNDMVSNFLSIKNLLQQVNRPDGIISPVEKMVPAIYTVCEELDLIIPIDLKFICFTNLPSAMFLNPPLTTITQPAFEMGKIAATALFQRIEKKKTDFASEKIVVPSLLIERKSTIG